MEDPRMRPSYPVRPACLAASLLLAACSTMGTGRHVAFASDPPGARVVVDGKDSGFVTPCHIALPTEEAQQVDLVLPGHKKESRMLVPARQAEIVFWREAYVREQVWRFPLWLALPDFVAPVKQKTVLLPSRVFVRMERESRATP
jgi:predicted small secreted protein